eukprot:403371921
MKGQRTHYRYGLLSNKTLRKCTIAPQRYAELSIEYLPYPSNYCRVKSAKANNCQNYKLQKWKFEKKCKNEEQISQLLYRDEYVYVKPKMEKHHSGDCQECHNSLTTKVLKRFYNPDKKEREHIKPQKSEKIDKQLLDSDEWEYKNRIIKFEDYCTEDTKQSY